MALPHDTPIADLGFSAEEAALLTPTAKSLTKADLLALQSISNSHRGKGEDAIVAIFDQRTGINLTVGDLSSIEHAGTNLAARRHIDAAAADTTVCCCCCPCCTCTASVVVEPLKTA